MFAYAIEQHQTEPLFYPDKSSTIHQILLLLGVAPNVLGYGYILYALELVLEDPNYLRGITTKLYPEIARKFGTTASRVERSIRTAISSAWLRGDLKVIENIFQNCVDSNRGVPSNSLFLARVYYYIVSTPTTKIQ